jgi:hypothetical protein
MEQWVRVTLVAIRKQRITIVTHGQPDDRRLIPAQQKDQHFRPA